MKVITSPEGITPEWLTGELKASGHLEHTEVIKVSMNKPIITLLNYVIPLRITYSDNLLLDVPRKLILKLNRPDPELVMPKVGFHEVEFYQKVASEMPDPPVPHCYASTYSEQTDQFYLLLEDLSETHVSHSLSQIPPTEQESYQIVAAIAQYQSCWWGHSRLGKDIGKLPTAQSIKAFCDWAGQVYPQFADILGDRLSYERRKLYERVLLDLNSALSKRLLTGQHLTLFHGDSHIGNYLTPLDPGGKVACIIDWDGWGVELGVSDLVSLIALLWFPERRGLLERPLLEHYYSLLLAQGVATTYSWEDCWNDYRLMILKALFYPIAHWKMKLSSDIWWNHLERINQAAQDLNCLELL